MSAGCPRCGVRVASGAEGAVCPGCLFGAGSEGPGRFDHLELGEPLGKGGMGEVFRAKDLRLGREVAVKFLPPSLAETQEGRARFEREARALAQLAHPHIVALHAFGEWEGQPYLSMELVDGPPLPQRLPLSRAEALRVAISVCEALAFAHARGIVHRDIKPANVLVAQDGQVKVADFGIARLWAEDAKGPLGALTRTGAVVGTPQYLAPEVLAGAAPDPRMDVFSVGVLVYELCTGRLPMGDYPALDGPLDRVVKRAMAQDPARRHPDVRALQAELVRAAQLDASLADALPDEERGWLRAVALVCAVAAALVFFAGLLSLSPRVLEPREVTPLVAMISEKLPDGRVLSRARFEVFPSLLAALGIGGALFAVGLLRRHWRMSGLDPPRPGVPVPAARWVFLAGLGACLLYALRRALEASGLVEVTLYIPLLGGVFELWVMYLVFLGLLEARRRSRPLAQEPLLWSGFVLALVPPVVEFVGFLSAWTP